MDRHNPSDSQNFGYQQQVNFQQQQYARLLQQQQLQQQTQQPYMTAAAGNVNVPSMYNSAQLLQQQQQLSAFQLMHQQHSSLAADVINQAAIPQMQGYSQAAHFQQAAVPQSHLLTDPFYQQQLQLQQQLQQHHQQLQQQQQQQNVLPQQALHQVPQHTNLPSTSAVDWQAAYKQPQTQTQPQQPPLHTAGYAQQQTFVHEQQNVQPEPAATKQSSQTAAETVAENARIMKEKEEEMRVEKEARDRRERERIQEEMQTKKQAAEQFQNSLQDRIRSFPEPLQLAGVHTLSKVSRFLPMPSENAASSSCLPCYDGKRAEIELAESTLAEAEYTVEALVAVTNDVRELDLKHGEDETNDLDMASLPKYIHTVMEINPNALSVEVGFPLNDQDIDVAFARDIQEAVERVAADDDMAAVFEEHSRNESADHAHPTSGPTHDTEPSTSFAAANGTAARAGGDASTDSAAHPRQEQLRRQMVSVGKQPKAAQGRKKRDMVESLYDSLTGYFDPSGNRRQRNRNKASEDEREESITPTRRSEDREATASPTASVSLKSTPAKAEKSEDEPKFFDKKSRKRPRPSDSSASDIPRPPTPTEIINQRVVEWEQKQKQRHEKYRRRQHEDWGDHDGMAETESITKFSSLIDQITEQVDDLAINSNQGDAEIAQEVLIDRAQLDELRAEAQKLKSWRRVNKIGVERLGKLLNILEKNIRDVLSEEGSLTVSAVGDTDDDSDETYRELVDERLIRAADAACTSLLIMTSSKMPKQVLMEDTIERSVQLCKQYLQQIIYPASDVACKFAGKPRKSENQAKRRKLADDAFSPTTATLYSRMTDLLSCFAELMRSHALNETVVFQLASVATPPFFIDNIGEIQMQAIKLLSTVYARHPTMRKVVLVDLLNSLHRLPSSRNQRNCYRLSANEWINNFTVLILQLVQSVVKLPNQKKHTLDESDDVQAEVLDTGIQDTMVMESYDEAQRLINFFLTGFLKKCTAKSEDDYRRLFEQFLHDVLAALYRPEWPVAELVLTVMGHLLVQQYRLKNNDLSLRVASLDYLGTIASRMRRDRVAAMGDASSAFEKTRLELVVKGIVYDELNDPSKNVDEIDISHLSSSDKIRKVEQALIDYIIGTKGDSDVSMEYAINFYVAEWYKETVEDMETAKERHRVAMADGASEREARKQDKKLQKILEKGEAMKEFILRLVDKKHLRKRHQSIQKSGMMMIDCDAAWAVKFLASKREFSQSFDTYLKQILYNITTESTVGLRTKAMKCLTQIIEADHEVLAREDVKSAVESRMVDANAAVREATLELIGKYLVSRPDLLNRYYVALVERIKDTGISVRKRVIRIFKEIVERQSQLEKTPEILARIIRRVMDEEGVKKLVIETFTNLWFQPVSKHEPETLQKKILVMADTVNTCMKENSGEHFDTLVSTIVKTSNESQILDASRQIVNALVDSVLSLDSTMANEENTVEDPEKLGQEQLAKEANTQGRLLASLTTLSVFAKARPELLVRHAEVFLPYLSMSTNTPTEVHVLNQVITMLDRIVPLMEHPSETFLASLDVKLASVTSNAGMATIAAGLSAMSSAYYKFKKVRPSVCQLFLDYLTLLSTTKLNLEQNAAFKIAPAKKPYVMRSLYSLGLITRHFDMDELLRGDSEAAAIASSVKNGGSVNGASANGDGEEKVLLENVYVLLAFFCRNPDMAVKQKALISLGHLTAEHPEFLNRLEVKNMYMYLLGERQDVLDLKIQVLKNITFFLQAEEERAVRNREQFKKQREEGDTEGEILKEMELSSSGLSSSVIQIYWNNILSCYFHPNEGVRTDTMQVVWQTLQQGLVTPGSAIPTLIAMCTDPLPNVRVRIELLIKDIDTKYAGMVLSKAIPGVRLAFRLQKQLADPTRPVRGIRARENATAGQMDRSGMPKTINDAEAVLRGLYTSYRSNRQQRRNFLASVLRQFAESAREKLAIDEWIFVADNLAHFPYQVLDEPLYVIHTADGIISVAGQNILNAVREIIYPGKLAPDADDEVSDLTTDKIYSNMPEDKSQLYALKHDSQACYILLCLKQYLMRAYGFKEDKLKEYGPSEGVKAFDKPLSRRTIGIFTPEFALRELRADDQRDTLEGHIKLAEHFDAFNRMFMQLDTEDYEKEDVPVTTNAVPDEDPDVVEGDEAAPLEED